MRSVRACVAVLLALTTASCADNAVPKPGTGTRNNTPSVEGPKDESVLLGDRLEAVELAVAMCVRQCAMNPVQVPKRIESLSERYANTRYNVSVKGCLSDVSGTTSFGAGGEITFTLTGDQEITMTFTNGAIGFRENDIWVQEGTELQVNDNKYTYQRGKWRVVK